MQNVVDFFILKQVYDQSLQRDWRPGKCIGLVQHSLTIQINNSTNCLHFPRVPFLPAGSRFRSVIDDYWWSGVVTEVSPYEDELPDSHFQCFVVGLVFFCISTFSISTSIFCSESTQFYHVLVGTQVKWKE
jgi:hypothetical protein